jgi:hypothetical protein
MAIIGNTVTSVPFIADSFSGNASTTSFSPLTRAPAGTASIAVFIAGTYQAPGSYTLSGTTITFTSPPASGVGNIIVLHLGTGSATQVTSDGSVTLTKLSSDTFGYINAAFTAANSAAATDTTQNTNITAASSYANAAFATANTGTASGSYANSAFSTANTASTNATNAGGYANSAFATANTASASGSYANSAFAAANSATATDATQNTNITSASTYANGAFAKANTAGVGTVTSVATGNGLTGGTITSSGTLSLDYYTGSDGNNTSYPVGSYIVTQGSETSIARNTSATLRYSGTTNFSPNGGTVISGTWRARGSLVFLGCANQGNLWQRTA